jgi:hypothetical protein
VTDDLARLAADLDRIPAALVVRLRPVADDTGRNVAQKAQRIIGGQLGRGGRTSLPRYAASITYDVEVAGATVAVEVGPETGGQGSFGHLIEDGTATSPPMPHMGPATDAEVAAWTARCADAFADAARSG